MNILVYGSKGWIGNQFTSILKDRNMRFYNGVARVDCEKDVLEEITQVSPSHIISFIGQTHGKIGEQLYNTIDYLEEEGKLVDNIRDNFSFIYLLADICSKRNIHYTYLGTGCIFNYDEEEHPFAEEINGFLGSCYSIVNSIVKGFSLFSF